METVLRGLRIATIGGDGVGPEVLEATLPVLHAAAGASGVSVETVALDWGGERLLRTRARHRAHRAVRVRPRAAAPRPGKPRHQVERAPDIAGKGIANPVASLLSAALLLDHAGVDGAGERIRSAVAATLRDSATHTPDLGGTATTTDLSTAVLTNLPALGSDRAPRMSSNLQEVGNAGNDLAACVHRAGAPGGTPAGRMQRGFHHVQRQC